MQSRPSLPLHEWGIIVLFCAILVLLALLAWGRSIPSSVHVALEPTSSLLQARIEGCVIKPGLYALSPSACQRELVEQGQPLPTADLSGVKEKRRLRDGETIYIPERR